MEQQSFQPHNPRGILYLVPTPIGNLEDMTFRAVRILNEVQGILAEDTRTTIKLLNHFEIATPMQSFHEHSTPQQVTSIIDRLLNGEYLALVSDAGMPLINDPGHPVVQEALKQQIAVVALPGANAALTALIASGLNCQQFTYYGFFPRQSKEQVSLLQQVFSRNETAIFYESPYRLKKTLSAIQKQGGEQVRVAVARELTKRYETYWRGTVGEVLAFLEEVDIKGECVLLIDGEAIFESQQTEDWLEWSIETHLAHCIEKEGMSSKDAIKHVAKLRQLKKQEVYKIYHEQR
ncbi:MAG: 16S rRNA (cytidine(1402)-2'-O)-methyltransferase [Aerococcaceae bacterium]|nr:16S rRNA (cytidine(1402)-2'-O)-methyltransferase [Aerococcaceae bacterium]